METHKKGKSGVLISRKAPACGATDTESDESPILVRKRKVSTNYSDDSDDDVPSRRRRRTTAVEVVGGRTFPAKFDNVLDVGQWGVLPNGIPPRAKICRTYVANIHLAFIDVFGKDNVSLEMCEHPNGDHSKRSVQCPYILEIAVLDAVLNRTKKTPRVLKSKKATVDTPVKMKITDVGLKDLKHDTRFRALVAVLPEAGVFYCHRERRKEYVGVANTHVPMDINWLRIVKNGSRDSCFASGGYVKRLWDGDAGVFGSGRFRVVLRHLQFLIN
ncbi:hypothetical protein MHU86_21269 [Fragilaria crotonensis]|nr:hypothetical protein MHU86_21269 [Fragilaria crotonensis]